MRSNMRKTGLLAKHGPMVACVQNGPNLVSYCTFSFFFSFSSSFSLSLGFRRVVPKTKIPEKIVTNRERERERETRTFSRERTGARKKVELARINIFTTCFSSYKIQMKMNIIGTMVYRFSLSLGFVFTCRYGLFSEDAAPPPLFSLFFFWVTFPCQLFSGGGGGKNKREKKFLFFG